MESNWRFNRFETGVNNDWWYNGGILRDFQLVARLNVPMYSGDLVYEWICKCGETYSFDGTLGGRLLTETEGYISHLSDRYHGRFPYGLSVTPD